MLQDPVTHLLAYLAIAEADNGSPALVPQWMRNAGHEARDVERAYAELRAAGLISGEDADSTALTEEGRAKSAEALSMLEPHREINFEQEEVPTPAPASGNPPLTRM
ncbi:MAG TPA: hypothetical protein VIA81_01135 [Acidimicrobiia bacterium]|jgi:hypothetical protein